MAPRINNKIPKSILNHSENKFGNFVTKTDVIGV